MEVGLRVAAALVALGFLGGIVAAGSMGYGPLGFITFEVIGGSSGGSSDYGLFTEPAYVELGTIEAGSSGAFNGTAAFTAPQAGYYEFDLENEDALKSVFSQFRVYVTVGDYTFTLDLYGEDSYEVYLEPGNYTVYFTVEYTVKSDASGSYNNLLFLKVELDDSSDDDDDS